MTAYVDTSVILRILFREAHPVEVWGKWARAFSSNLWRVEALRTVDRLRLSGGLSDEEVADLIRDIRVVHETLAIHPLTERILQRASETFPTVVGTLDAIHLATALAIREVEPIDLLLTHDTQLGTAARSLGFSVLGVGTS
jgi:predicted nucleic acid-binding protein